MAVLHKEDNAILLDHGLYIAGIYRKTKSQKNEDGLVLKPCLFCIKNDKTRRNGKKRKHDACTASEETSLVKEAYNCFKEKIPLETKLKLTKEMEYETGFVRDRSKALFESTVFNHVGLTGGNDSDEPLKCPVKGEEFLIPNKCRFYSSCIKEACIKLKGNKYQLVIADPPWWNKYIRRLKGANDKLSYTMMYNEEIASIPVKDLLAPDSLIAMWCTNAPSNISAVKDQIFPRWGIEYVTTWFWLKVTNDLEPLCDFGTGSQKQPYERILIGKVGSVKEVPAFKLIVSVPSALHSHKPPLLDILTQYLDMDNPSTLELFARYLLPNTTSIGYEPLKWQHISLYDKCESLGA